MRRIIHTFSFALLVLQLGSCIPATSPIPLPSLATGSLSVSASFPVATNARLTADPLDVARVRISASWAGGSTPTVDMTKVGPMSYVLTILNLPAETPLQLYAEALGQNDEELFEGNVTNYEVPANATSDVVIDLLPVARPNAAGAPPRITGVRKPLAPVTVHSIFPIEIDVADPDSGELTFQFAATGGQFATPAGVITMENGAGTIHATYTAPATPGIVELTISVTDHVGFSALLTTSLLVVAIPPPPGDTGGTDSSVNFAPAILAIHVSATDNVSELAILATVSDDQPLEQLSFEWTIDGNPAGTTNPIAIPANVGTVEIGLMVSDARGAASQIEFDVDTAATEISDLPLSNHAPVLVAAFLSTQDVSFGDVVTATLYATDLEGGPLVAQWETDWGTILSTENTTNGSFFVHRAEWTGGIEASSALLSARISDPQGGVVECTFNIVQILGRVDLTAEAGTNQSVFLDADFVLDGSLSSSDDGQILSYAWQQLSGPASTIQSPNAAQTIVTPTLAGTYVYELTVSNTNNSASDTVAVVVSDPTAFAFIDSDVDQNAMVYFLDSVNRLVRRYDLAARAWKSSFAAGVENTVRCFAVAPEGDAVYVGYEGGRMDVFNTTSGGRTLFANNPATVNRMYVVGNHLYTQDPTGAWATRSLYNRETGIRTFSAEWTYTSNGFQYSSVLSRLFHFRDGTSPNDIIYSVVNHQAGTMGSQIDSPYHGGYSFGHPLRLFPDHTRIAVASGTLFSTGDLTVAGGLGMSYVDLRFNGELPVLIRASGSTSTELVELNVNFSVARTRIVSGPPLRLFVHDGSAFIIVSDGTNNVKLHVLSLE